MDLVRVARFLDLTEAEVVASALRSSGMEVFVQNEVTGRWLLHLAYAMGGFGVWVPEADAEDARAFIRESREQASALEPLPVAEAGARTTASLLLTFLTGYVVPLRPKRPSRLPDLPEAG